MGFTILSDERFAIDDFAISPDGQWLAVCGYEQPLMVAKLGDQISGSEFVSLADTQHIGPCGMSFSLDSRWLIVDYQIGSNAYQIWDLSNGVIGANRYLVNKIDPTHYSSLLPVFSADSQIMVGGGGFDGKIRVWDMKSVDGFDNPTILEIEPYQSQGTLEISVSPDKKWVAVGNEKGEILLWQIDLDQLISLSCKYIGRNLSYLEWKQYFPDEKYRSTCPQWPVDEDALAAMDN